MSFRTSASSKNTPFPRPGRDAEKNWGQRLAARHDVTAAEGGNWSRAVRGRSLSGVEGSGGERNADRRAAGRWWAVALAPDIETRRRVERHEKCGGGHWRGETLKCGQPFEHWATCRKYVKIYFACSLISWAIIAGLRKSTVFQPWAHELCSSWGGGG